MAVAAQAGTAADAAPALVLSDADAELSVEEFLHKTCDSLVADVLASAESSANSLRAAFRAEKASVLSAYDAAAKAGASSSSSSSSSSAGTSADGSSSSSSSSTAARPRGPMNVRTKILTGPHAGFERVLKPRQRRLVPKIGRSAGPQFEKNGVSLPDDEEVSTTHAKIDARAGTLYVTDLDSTNGSLLDGVRLNPREAVALPPRSVLRVGRSELELVLEAEE